MTTAARILLGFLGILVLAHVHVTLYLAGEPERVPVLLLAVPVLALTDAIAAWIAWGVPRQGWPRLIWISVST